jgi:ferric-dicitrate binding protein FerR (iron transport regulator)
MAERELDELFRAWRSEPLPPSSPPELDDRAGSAIVAAALRRVAEQKQRKQRARQLVAALALAASVLGLGVGAWYALGRDASVAQGEAPSVVVGGREGEVAVTDDVGHVVEAVSALSEGYGVRTEQGSATLSFPSGASARVSSKSSLKITRARSQEALFLARGGVDVEVPKLGPTRGFSVETPDARVTVHGTHFSVMVEPTTDGPRTRVQVSHGIVSVQQGSREVFLTAGQSFATDVAKSDSGARSGSLPRAGEAQAPAGDADAGFDDDEVDEGAPSPADDKPVRRRARRKFDSRELADQNQRFARAMAHKKNGEPRTALRELAGILRRYPGSPLTQELRVERLRLLRALGATRPAEREARRYLREFPDGYAVNEAEELLSGAE